MKVVFNRDNIHNDDIISTFDCAVSTLTQPQCIECEVNFVSTTQIRRLNRLYRNIDAVTDVLSFPMLNLAQGEVIDSNKYSLDVDVQTGNVMIGEVYLCSTVAKQQAVEYGHSLKREVCFLALHGLLHLLGYDHVDDEQRSVMENTQDIILDKVGIIN
ncbi:MAG: rRNA maturation RNase YbeY [Clostridia bacterium]|nr:rRNA maturation RNase YbeY [Clostridia bacterium]